MLFRQEFWSGLEDGTITVAFRRWRRASVKMTGTLLTPGGLLAIDEVVRIEPGEITDEDARRAGYHDRVQAMADLRPEGDLYRIRFHRVGDDPRHALRENDRLDAEDVAAIAQRLRRLPWAVPILRLIGDHPGVVSTDLAAALSVDRPTFKQRVRRLKTLGLTESLEIGYRLSPRGRAWLDRIDAGD